MIVKRPNQFKTRITKEGRECTACAKFKKWEEFTTHTRSATGKTSKCKECKRKHRPARDFKREKYSAKKHLEALKVIDPYEIKARRIRGSLLNRARKNPLLRPTTPLKQDIKDWLLTQPLVCHYSGVPVDLFDIVVDHKIPVNRGGTNCFSNLCITNHKHNTSKGWMTETEYKDLLKLVTSWEDKGEGLLKRLRQGFF